MEIKLYEDKYRDDMIFLRDVPKGRDCYELYKNI